VMRAARYLILHGPATQQERWEEAGGYSPSTIASNIAALVCAASFARERGDGATGAFLEEYADFLECHVEAWMATTEGTLVSGISRHFIRILPVDVSDPFPPEDPNLGYLALANRPPGSRWRFPAKEIVDGGFLELVRYGIRKADDPVIVDSLRVLDAVLKVDTPDGPCWRRYNNDGYGQREDGGPFVGYGKGRAWPLLTGERGHYELAAGRAPAPYLRALEGFASPTGLLPEQVWDEPDRPDLFMFLGRPTGSARPLMWAHAEYIKLLRSAADGKVFDLVRPRMAGLWHTVVTPAGTPLIFEDLRKVYAGPVVQTQDLTVFNVTAEAVVARQAQVEPQPRPVPGKPEAEPEARPPVQPDWWADALIPLDDVLSLP